MQLLKLLALTLGLATAALPAAAGAQTTVDRAARSRAMVVEDAQRMFGRPATAEILRARSFLLVRRPVQFPGPPGPPTVAAAVRGASGWVRIGAGGRRSPMEPIAGLELDRLVASPSFWREPAFPNATCTDQSGILMLGRHGPRERLSSFPCGWSGLAGQAARIVLAGGIVDWATVEPGLRPAGVPIVRFDEATQTRFRFMSGMHEQRLLAIRSAAEWQGQWMRLLRRRDVPPPRVDFSREMLLMAAMGPQPRGGYRVVIDRVIDAPGERLVFARFVSPGPRCGAIAAVTSPVDIVRVPVSEADLRWVIEREATDCR